jgi:hypothetical protein
MKMNGFNWVSSDNYAVPSRITHIPGTATEVYTKGEALDISSTGAWTKSANGGRVGGFANQTKTCTASDLTLEVIQARAGDRFRAPYTGSPAAGFVLGVKTADISTDGLSVLSSDVTGGIFALWDTITSKTECVVTVINRIFE